MNEIKLKGNISGIEFSHIINGIEYQKADFIVPKENGEFDTIPLRFRSTSNKDFKEGDLLVFDGNIRSYSQKLDNGKNRVNIYVFTYFDPTEDLDIYDYFQVDGRVCKLDKIRGSSKGDRFHLTLANNIISRNNKQKLNNYLPVVCYGD